MSELQPSPDLQALYAELSKKAGYDSRGDGGPTWGPPTAKPIIERWLVAHDAAKDAEIERLRTDHERLLDKIKWLGHLAIISQEVAASLLGTVWVQP